MWPLGPVFKDGDVIGTKVERMATRHVAFQRTDGLGDASYIEGWSGVLQPAVSPKGKGQGVDTQEVSSLPHMAGGPGSLARVWKGTGRDASAPASQKRARLARAVNFKVANTGLHHA